MLPDLTSVTRTTFRVVDFLSWQRHGHLDLRPPFQRESVWTKKAKSYLIDTMLRGYPVPLIFIQDQTDAKTFEPRRQVVDGQQRLRTVLAYVDPSCLPDLEESDDFSILRAHRSDRAGARFNDLDADEQRRILDYEFSVHVLSSGTPNKVLLEIFSRMNSTGVRLNHQENRNAEYHGVFKQVAYELALTHLDDWLEWKVLSRTQIARMRDRELTSELILFLHEGITAKRQETINTYYKKFDDDYPYEKEVRRRFERVMETLRAAYSEELDVVFDESFSELPFNTQGWFFVLFAFVHNLSFGEPGVEQGSSKAKTIDVRQLRAGLADRAAQISRGDLPDDLMKALRGAATDRSSRLARYEFLSQGE